MTLTIDFFNPVHLMILSFCVGVLIWNVQNIEEDNFFSGPSLLISLILTIVSLFVFLGSVCVLIVYAAVKLI